MIAIPRAYWEAQHGSGSPIDGPVDMVIVHHFGALGPAFGAAVSEEVAVMQSTERFHARVRGWAGFAYNFAAFQSGRIYTGRGWGRAGAHAGSRDWNRRSVGLAWAIDARSQYPTPESMSAARDLLREGIVAGHLSHDFQVAPHSAFRATECPGPYLVEVLEELTRLAVPEPDFRSVDHIPARLRPLPLSNHKPA